MSRKKPDLPAPAPTPGTDAGRALKTDADALYGQVREVLAQARGLAHRQVNQAMVLAYWHVGRLIVEHEQAGAARAAYGARLLPALAERLTADFGPGFAVQSLRNFRQLYQVFPAEQIRSTPWSELSWSHLKALMRVADPEARRWYATEGDGPTLGLILCSERNEAVARYSRLAAGGSLYASRYQACMPTEAELQAELARDRALLELGREE